MMIVRHSYISVKGKGAGNGRGIKAARSLAVGTALSHVKYIQHRPGKDREQEGRDVFTDMDDSADSKMLRKQIREYEGRGVVIHKLTLSPEVNPNDPKGFTREVMYQLGSEKGLDLEWWAVAHKNTDRHHIHVVVMPKDREGRAVRFDKADYDRLKQCGDKYLERTQYSDCRMAELVRQEKNREQQKERREQLERERQERIQKGEELPWLHKKIVREQLEPYKQWDKGRQTEQEDSFEYLDRRYSKDDGYERLSGLRKHLQENTDKSLRLPKEHYKRLENWIEQKDRARFAGELDRQLAGAKDVQAAGEKVRSSPAANRYVAPLQQEMMRNPIMALFLSEASIAAEIVRSIPLTDQRDRLKENRDELEDAKRDREATQKQRRNSEQKAEDEEIIGKLDEAIDENKNVREDMRKQKQKEKDKRDRDIDFMR